jgi:hypothetical protein
VAPPRWRRDGGTVLAVLLVGTTIAVLQGCERRATDSSGPRPTDSSGPRLSCRFGSFDSRTLPGACWRPFGKRSPFNRRVGTSPRLLPRSRAVVARTARFGPAFTFEGGVAGTRDDWGATIYYSRRRDPRYRVHCVARWSRCEIEGARVRIPARARPAAGGDGHMAVIDQAARWEYDFWQVRSKPRGGGRITIRYGGRTRIGTPDAHGLGSNATAAHFALSAGVIRPAELAAGRIDHALFMTVPCTNGTYVPPATGPGVGRPCSEIGLPNRYAPALGQHFYVAMGKREISALRAPAWKKAVLHAMARYGMFVGDTGGGDSWGVKTESGTTYTSLGHPDPWVRLGRRLGLPSWRSSSTGTRKYLFDLRGLLDWGSRLRVVHPCVSRGRC